MKLKKKALIASAATFAAATVLLVILPSSANLWVSYFCCLIALGMLLAGAYCVVKRKIPNGGWRLKRRLWILPASLVISIAVLLLEYLDILCLPFEMHIVAQLAVLAPGTVKMLSIGIPKRRRAKPAVEANAEKVPAQAENKE